MAPRGRKKAGMTREDAARDAMRKFGFAERLITLCIKELLEVYGEGGWFLIEDCAYMVLINKCLERGQAVAEDNKQVEMPEEKLEEIEQEQTLQLEDEMVETEQNHEMVEAEQEDEMVEAEQNDEMVEAEPEQTLRLEDVKEEQVEDGRDHVGSNSTSLVGCAAETGTPKTCQTEALSITSQTNILDSSPAGEASVIDYASPPVAFPSAADVSEGFAQHNSAEGAKSSGCGGWLSEEDEDSDPDADSVGDDDEMIQLTPEPLCEELEELISEIRGEKHKRKRPTRWEN